LAPSPSFSPRPSSGAAAASKTKSPRREASTRRWARTARTTTGVVVGFDKAFRWPTVVELGARYTASHAVFRHGKNAGHLLPYAPEHTASADFDVEHPSGVGGRVAYWFVGPQYVDELNTIHENAIGTSGRLDPWHIVDVTAHFRHKPSNLTFRITAKNLFDATYIAARRPNGIFTGLFRQIIVGVRWEWDGPGRAP
jgi:outer membrane receptor protein involved in Fe transport